MKPVSERSPSRSQLDTRERRPSRLSSDRGRPGGEREPGYQTSIPKPIQNSGEGTTRLYITLGRKDGFTDLASLAQYLSDASKVDLGHFSGGGMIRDTSAHIEVDDDVADNMIKALNNSARPNATGDNDSPVICEMAKGPTFQRPHTRYPQRRRPSYPKR